MKHLPQNSSTAGPFSLEKKRIWWKYDRSFKIINGMEINEYLVFFLCAKKIKNQSK